MKFDEVYKKLNERQKKAVDTLEGPLLVLAGPGTGKTQLLSARVANILLKTDTDPSSITCLTFTVNAANNMRERLRGMIGSTANQVVIKTFHSLAADLIAANPQHFYAGATLNPVSDLAAQEILYSIFEKLPHDNPLAAQYDDNYSYLGGALDAIGKAKDAGLTPERLKEVLQQNAQDIETIEPQVVELLAPNLSHKTLNFLAENIEAFAGRNQNSPLATAITRLLNTAIENDQPTTKSAATSKLKGKLLKNDGGVKRLVGERRANAWWLALADVYQAYQLALYKRGYLDYSDMLLAVIKTLEEDQDLRLDIQENTQYLLVDEFQDSNQAQITLARLLTDNPGIESPNVMVVGDPNQTIYGFNGAVLDNVDQFKQHYGKSLKTVDLIQNYRSTQTILDNAKQIIEPYSSYHPELVANTDVPDASVVYASYATPNDQAVSIGEQASKIIAEHPDQTVAILGRGHNSLAYIARYLHDKQVAVDYEQVIDIRCTKANQLILNVARILQALVQGDRKTVNHQLSLLIQHQVFEYDGNTLWQIATAAKKSEDWLTTCLENDSTKPLIEWLQSLARVAASEPINSLLEQLLASEYAPGKALYGQLFKSDDAEKTITEAQATTKLIDLAKQYAQTEKVGIDEFIALTNSDAKAKLFSFSPNVGRHSQAVNLMTVHAAKGLEFDHVMIIDVDDRNWKPSRARYPVPLSLDIHTELESAEDYARLLYVAMTRAKQSLAISYIHGQEGDAKALAAEQLTGIEFSPAEPVSDAAFAETTVQAVLFPRPKAKTMHELLADQLTNFKLSPTALTNFLDLTRGGPTHFIEQNLLKLPEPASATLIHGNAMHSAMELAQIQTNNGKYDLDAIKRLYAKKVRTENLPNQAAERLIGKGEAQLDALFGKLNLQLEVTSLSEQGLPAILPDNTPLYGKIDRLDVLDEKHLRVVDYKTGKPLLTMDSNAEPNLLKMWRHNLQLGFYILLLKHTPRYADKKYASQIIQLDSSDAEHLYLDYTLNDAETERIASLATAVYNHIINLDMPDVSSYEQTLAGIQQFEADLLQGIR